MARFAGVFALMLFALVAIPAEAGNLLFDGSVQFNAAVEPVPVPGPRQSLALDLASFEVTLAADIKGNKCNLNTAANVKGTAGALKSASPPPAGDRIYMTGTMQLNGGTGSIDGGLATLSFFTSSAKLSTLEFGNLSGSGMQTLLCGGTPSSGSSSGPGSCSAVCTSAPCTIGGGPAIGSTAVSGATFVLHMFPLANSPSLGPGVGSTHQQFTYCQGSAGLTWAECCGDPSLDLKLKVTFGTNPFATSATPRAFAAVTDLGAGGVIELFPQ